MLSRLSRNSTSVLVINDDQAESKMLRHNLEDGDTRVIEAPTSSDHTALLNEASVNLVLLDLGQQDLQKRSFPAYLRSARSLRNVPVILLCAEPPTRSLMEQLQPNDCIQKPFDMRDLLARVRNVIAATQKRENTSAAWA